MQPTQHTSENWRFWRSLSEIQPAAAERGRLLAAHQIATDPEARKRVEDAFGVELCRANYPEAYRHTGRFGGFVKFLDGVRAKIPW